MESTTSNIDESGSEKLEPDSKKVNENGERAQDNVKGTGNRNPGENVAAAVGNIAHVGEHNDSSCPMAVEEVSSVPSHCNGRPLETNTKDDGLLKSNTETTHADEYSQLEKSLHQSPPPVSSLDLDPEKRLVNPITESMVEQNKESSQVSLGLSKIEGDSAKVGKDTSVDQESSQVSLDLSKIEGGSSKVGEETPADQGRMATVPDNKALEDNVKGTIKNDAEILMEQDKDSIEPDAKSLQDHNKCAVVSGIETSKGNENGIGKADATNSADHEKGPVQPHSETSMDDEKGSNAPGCETQSKNENEPSKPDMETSTNLEKGADAPATQASGALRDLDTLTDKDKRPDVLATAASGDQDKGSVDMPAAQTSSDQEKGVTKLEAEPVEDMKVEVPDSKVVPVGGEPAADAEKKDNSEASQRKDGDAESASMKHEESEPVTRFVTSTNLKSEEERRGCLNNGVHKVDSMPPTTDGTMNSKHSFLLDDMSEGNESGTEEEQSAFMKELENFFRERSMEFKPPKFYGEGLNCLKLWRAVTRLGGYDKVTSCKLWRQVGESFRPPKTCTTVSWTFRGFYEKALLEYERHKVNGGEIQIPLPSHSEPMNVDNQASGSGRARRDAAARAMQGWHSQRLLGNGEVSDPIIKDKSSVPQQKREKQIVTPGLLKRKKPPSTEQAAKAARTQVSKSQLDVTVVDLGPPADWVKINVQRTKDCFEVYALVPGLLREEVRVQSDPAGRLVITGEPENPNNLWGATPFKKVVSLPTRIDPYHTSAVVTLNGQLFVRVPLEQSD